MAKDKETKELSSNKKSEKALKQKPAKSSRNIVVRFVGYLKGVVQELKRVTWPTPKEMLNSGIIVIVTLIFFAIFTFFFDSAATKGVTALANMTSKETSAPAQVTTTEPAVSTPTTETSK